MTWDQIKGDWQQLSATLREKWTTLTDAELVAIAGRRELVVGLLGAGNSSGSIGYVGGRG